MNAKDIPEYIRIQTRIARHKLTRYRLIAEQWVLKKKLAYLRWKISLIERAETLQESREFQRGKNDE